MEALRQSMRIGAEWAISEILSRNEAEMQTGAAQMKFIATRFAHQCRLKGVITNDETLRLYDEWIKQEECDVCNKITSNPTYNHKN